MPGRARKCAAVACASCHWHQVPRSRAELSGQSIKRRVQALAAGAVSPDPRFPPWPPDLKDAGASIELGVDAPDEAISFEERHGVVAIDPPRRRCEGFEAVLEAEESLKPCSISNDGIKWRENHDSIGLGR